MKVDQRLHVPYLADVLEVQPTDGEGRFEIRGLGKERAIWTQFTSPRTAATTVVMVSRDGFDPAQPNRAASSGGFLSYRRQTPELHGPDSRVLLESTKIIEGRVTALESDAPIAGVVVHANAGYMASVLATTDEDGRYRLIGLPKRDDELLVSFNPPSGGRLLPRTLAVEQSAGLAPMRFDVGLREGVVITGRVTDKKTGEGVRAGIRVAPLPENEYVDQPGYDIYKRSRVMEGVDADGRFRFVTIPGASVVVVQAYGTDIEIDGNPVKLYTEDRFSDEELKRVTVREDGESFIAHGNAVESFQEAMKVIDIPADAGEFRCDLTVDPGRTLEVAIQDDQGRPLTGTIVCGMTQSWPITFTIDEPTCTIYALDPTEPRQVIFYHPERRLAATRAFRGDEAERPVVRLAPTRTLVGRALDKDGQPLAGASVDGSWRDDTARELQRQLNMTREALYTDDDGRFRVEGALPGVFRLAFRHGDKRYTTDSRWEDARAIAAAALGPGGSEVDLSDIVVQPR